MERLEGTLRTAPEPVKNAAKRVAAPFDGIQRWRYRRQSGYSGPIPPAVLRARVGAGISVPGFFETGKLNADWIERVVDDVGIPFKSRRLVYDWGCGCGRVLIPLQEKVDDGAVLAGSDVDAEAIEWASRAFPEMRLAVNGFAPPLPVEDGSVDCLISSSIFTHLDEPEQDVWLDEVRRVLAPGGVAVISVAGAGMHEPMRSGLMPTRDNDLSERLAAMPDLDDEGFIFVPYKRTDLNDRDFPGITGAYGLTFHSAAYVAEHWGRSFEVLAHRERIVNAWQDLVVVAPRG
jgi:SAM-dependent methyltransferase